MTQTSKLIPLIFKVSDGVYKKYLEHNYGINACTGVLKNQEIDDLSENLYLLNYIIKHQGCGCNKEKLIETLS